MHGSAAPANETTTPTSITHEVFILIRFCIYNKVIEWESQAPPPPPELIVVECRVEKTEGESQAQTPTTRIDCSRMWCGQLKGNHKPNPHHQN